MYDLLAFVGLFTLTWCACIGSCKLFEWLLVTPDKEVRQTVTDLLNGEKWTHFG